jgi:hypothetical protein
VADAPSDHWPSVVDDRLEWMFRIASEPSPDLDGPTEQFIDRIYARLRPVEGSPTEWWNYAREIAPGELMVLALDYPDHIGILNDKQVERHGFNLLVQAGGR